MKITSYSHLLKQELWLNGKAVFSGQGPFQAFAEQVYRFLEIQYPRFHKMDPLCKLGFLASDIMLKNNNLSEKYGPFGVGVVLSNCHASLDTDLKHLEGLRKGMTSPAVFVYSLPNIVIGEICIRNQIKGENTFFVSETFDIQQQVRYIRMLFEARGIKACLGGWVEISGENYQAFQYVVEEADAPHARSFNEETLQTLYSLPGA